MFQSLNYHNGDLWFTFNDIAESGFGFLFHDFKASFGSKKW